jgi:hypothetical protein
MNIALEHKKCQTLIGKQFYIFLHVAQHPSLEIHQVLKKALSDVDLLRMAKEIDTTFVANHLNPTLSSALSLALEKVSEDFRNSFEGREIPRPEVTDEIITSFLSGNEISREQQYKIFFYCLWKLAEAL